VCVCERECLCVCGIVGGNREVGPGEEGVQDLSVGHFCREGDSRASEQDLVWRGS